MTEKDPMSQLRKGLLEFAVLQIIAARKVYAADILEVLEPTPFHTGEGTLYPLVSRLKREQLVTYDWVESGQGPPRKYYHLTAAGKKRLQELRASWQTLQDALQQLGGQ